MSNLEPILVSRIWKDLYYLNILLFYLKNIANLQKDE